MTSVVGAGVVAGGWWVSESRLTQVWEPVVEELTVTRSAGRLEHGRHLVEHVLACAACHGEALAGGRVVEDSWDGEVWAPNITGGGRGTDYWVRALRHGVDSEGRGLMFMPVSRYASLRTDDLVDVVSWLEGLPALEGETPDLPVAPWVRARLVFEGYGASARQEALPVTELHPRPDAVWGGYLAGIAGCVDCHRAGEEAGRSPQSLRGPVLDASWASDWTGAEFAAAVTGGQGKTGPVGDAMPWRQYSGLTDLERDALWLWARSDDAVASLGEAESEEHQVQEQ